MNGNSLTVKDPFHHPDNAGTVIVVPQQRGDDQREDDLNKFLRSKDVVKNRRIYIFIPHQDHVEALLNVFPRFCHQLLPTGLIFTDKAHGVHGEETGIYFIPTPHTFIGPFNAVWKPQEARARIDGGKLIVPVKGLRLVSKMASLEVMTVFTFSRPILNDVHYSIPPLICQDFFVSGLYPVNGRNGRQKQPLTGAAGCALSVIKVGQPQAGCPTAEILV